MILEVFSEAAMKDLGRRLGEQLRGGEMIELIGDVGAGKTTFTKGLALGLAIDEDVQSPTFTINRMYEARDNLRLAHYDFYRLSDAGIMAHELAEVISDPSAITIVEWAEAAQSVLPPERLQIRIVSPSIETRKLDFIPRGARYEALVGDIA